MSSDTRKQSREAAYRKIRPVLDTESVSTSAKTLNLFWVNLRLNEILEELSEDKGRSPELVEVMDFIQLAKSKMREYTDRVRSENLRSNPR